MLIICKKRSWFHAKFIVIDFIMFRKMFVVICMKILLNFLKNDLDFFSMITNLKKHETS
jgi:hypothetical protein